MNPRTSADAQRALRMPHTRHRLANGLDVILHPDPALPVVVVNLWYRVGSRDETPGRSGFAHLFEHLMFMGTDRVPTGAYDQILEAHGGMNNAWTSEDATDYYDLGPSNLLELMLWLEADRMSGLGRGMTQEKLDLQRDVVRNERRQSYEDEPYGVAWLALPELLYPAGHPYAHPIIGSHADLEAASVQDVRDFFSRWYAPDQASLVIAGDFDPDRGLALAERHFGAIAPVGGARAPGPPAPERPVASLLELEDRVQIPQTMILWHTPAAMAPGDAELDLLSSILGAGRSSRLYRRLVYGGLAHEVQVAQMSQDLSSLFFVQARPAPGHALSELEDAVHEEIARIQADGPTEEEVERALNQYEMRFLRKLESVQSRAAALNRYWNTIGEPDGLAADLARYESATREGIAGSASLLPVDRAATLRVASGLGVTS